MPQPSPTTGQPASTIRILLIDDDPILRAGIGACLRQVPGLELQHEVDRPSEALPWLSSLSQRELPTLILLNAELGQSPPGQRSPLKWCRSLRAQCPALPLLLLGSSQDPDWLLAAQRSGGQGYWLKGRTVEELVTAIRQVAWGETWWLGQPTIELAIGPLLHQTQARSPWTSFRHHVRGSGLRQIEATLRQVEQDLQQRGLAVWDQAILAGRQRELRAARWLVNQLLAQPAERMLPPEPITPRMAVPRSSSSLGSRAPAEMTVPPTAQMALWQAIEEQLVIPVYNATATPLEIDILRPEQRRSLLQLVLTKLEQTLERVKASQLTAATLPSQTSAILTSLWQETVTDFFGKYYTLTVEGRSFNLVDRLLQDGTIVQAALLDRIPATTDLLAHLVFQTPLMIDGVPHAPGTVAAMQRAELLLHTLIIQVANAVMQPLLNRVGNVVEIKQTYYAQELLSTREIERFRNDLAWTYRINRWVGDPIAIFESRHDMLQLTDSQIRRCVIYAPRNQEFAQLQGVPLLITLALELRDAIAPRLRTVISFLGSSTVYVLTEVIGRAIGLVGRGIIKGIGNTLQDPSWLRTNERWR